MEEGDLSLSVSRSAHLITWLGRVLGYKFSLYTKLHFLSFFRESLELILLTYTFLPYVLSLFYHSSYLRRGYTGSDSF